MSAWGKFLPSITVPTGGYALGLTTQVNLVTDGNMEAADTSAWTASRSTPLPTLTKETGTPHGGTRCLRIATGAGDNGTALQDCGLGTVSRTITGWARSNGTALPCVYQNGHGYVWAGSNSTSWQSISATWTSAGDTIEFLNNSANQYVEFDDIVILSTAAQTATIAAGTYASVLHMLSTLETSLQAIDATFSVTLSQTGTVSIACDNTWSVNWGTTTNALETLLGFDGTETVSGSTLTASDEHRYGWYPGVISFGTTQGEGLAEDTEWVPQETETRAVAGSGQIRCTRPSRDDHNRRLRFDLIGRTERMNPYRGVAMMERYAVDRRIAWYPDRAVGSTGIQGDPQDDPRDSSCDYWLVTMISRPRVDGSGKHPDWFSVELEVNGEPD